MSVHLYARHSNAHTFNGTVRCEIPVCELPPVLGRNGRMPPTTSVTRLACIVVERCLDGDMLCMQISDGALPTTVVILGDVYGDVGIVEKAWLLHFLARSTANFGGCCSHVM